MSELKKMLEDQIETEIQNLAILEPGSEDKVKAVTNLDKLYRLKLEEEKIKLEDDDKIAMYTIKKSESKFDKILNGVKVGGEIVLGLGSLAAYAICFMKGLKFEEEGTVTSSFLKSLVGKKPGK